MNMTSWILGPRAASPPAHHNYWYGDVGEATQAGVRITEENAMRVSTVNICVRILSSVIAMLPQGVFERTGQFAREPAQRHRLSPVLKQPNASQTGFEYRQQQIATLLLRGNYYAEILPTRRGAIGELIPIHPDHVKVDRTLETRRRVYDISDRHDGRPRVLTQDEVHHVHLLSLDGLTGLSPVGLAREGIGFAKSLELHGGLFFGRGQRPGGVFTSEQKFTKEQREELKESWKAAHEGVDGWHTPAVLGGGLKFEQMMLSNEDSQFLETRGFQAADISGIYGVPIELLNHRDKGTVWGTGVEHFMIGFKTFTIQPLVCLIEDAHDRDLLSDPDRDFVEHDMDALMRADMKTRMDAHGKAIQSGIRSPDEARRKEGDNPRIDGRGGIFWRPANMIPDDGTPAPEGRRAGERNAPVPSNGKSGAIEAPDEVTA